MHHIKRPGCEMQRKANQPRRSPKCPSVADYLLTRSRLPVKGRALLAATPRMRLGGGWAVVPGPAEVAERAARLRGAGREELSA